MNGNYKGKPQAYCGAEFLSNRAIQFRVSWRRALCRTQGLRSQFTNYGTEMKNFGLMRRKTHLRVVVKFRRKIEVKYTSLKEG